MGTDPDNIINFPERPGAGQFPESLTPAEATRLAYIFGGEQMYMREQATTGRDRVDTDRVVREIHHSEVMSDTGQPFITPEQTAADQQRAYINNLDKAA
ncbi:MAG: hypothetical protein R3313_03815 [Candidatus Saccharimonadales bacterium]|nr:hypothetical protein [Candidatus Saccharimonadales bacterium]